MTPRKKDMQTTSRDKSGYTLLEVIVVTVILGIVGSAASFVLINCLRTYNTVAPSLFASYEATLATERMKRELRNAVAGSITTVEPRSVEFVNEEGESVNYRASAENLYRNDDLLVENLEAFELAYWSRGGQPATTPSEVHLIELDVTARVRAASFRSRTAVFPRGLGE